MGLKPLPLTTERFAPFGGVIAASRGAEIDLVLTLPGRDPWAIEIKRSLDPKPAKGFHSACEDVKPEARFVIYPGAGRFSVSKEIEALNPAILAEEIVTKAG
jgi:hypothetical protein